MFTFQVKSTLEQRLEQQQQLVMEPLRRKQDWPEGTYGLLKTKSGCPSGGGWYKGYRQHDTERIRNRNAYVYVIFYVYGA